jgi:signal transduction histidine kinase
MEIRTSSSSSTIAMRWLSSKDAPVLNSDGYENAVDPTGAAPSHGPGWPRTYTFVAPPSALSGIPARIFKPAAPVSRRLFSPLNFGSAGVGSMTGLHRVVPEGRGLTNRIGSFEWTMQSGHMRWCGQMFRILGYEPTAAPHLDLLLRRVHAADLARLQAALAVPSGARGDTGIGLRLVLPDGTSRQARLLAEAGITAVPRCLGQLVDLTPEQPAAAAEAMLLLRDRLGLCAAQELRQPLCAISLYSQAALRWLGRDEPAIEEARRAVAGLVSASNQALALLQAMNQGREAEGGQHGAVPAPATPEARELPGMIPMC